MKKHRVNILSPQQDIIALFQEAATATQLESSGQMKICRCSQAIEGMPDQPTCDLPLTPREQTTQMNVNPDPNAEPVKNFLCRVHANPRRFRAIGVDPVQVYDGSLHMGAILLRLKAPKVAV